MKRPRDLWIAPLAEGGLLLIVSAISWAAHQPFIFASLGPTIYQLVEQPEHAASRPYNVVAGHFVGIGAGYFALWSLNAWATPTLAQAGFATSPRIWAVVVAAVITVLVCLLIGASQPASLSTTLLISLGTMQSGRDAIALVVGVVTVAILGEPIRHWRKQRIESGEKSPPPAAAN